MAAKRRAEMTPEELEHAREKGREYSRARKERYNKMKEAEQQKLEEQQTVTPVEAPPASASEPDAAEPQAEPQPAAEKQTAPASEEPPRKPGPRCGACGRSIVPGQMYCQCGDVIDWRGSSLESSPAWVVCDKCGAAHPLETWRGKCLRCGEEY